ncbi:hypothetical protein [Marinobacterium rhizophilum]|uniref:Uncharacterized protein n=1 Tax=Marinobacterium rhizophilum TaxID=420402 RepID=A0ABY5HJ63_9GAMM|nr:hypothetical protein [Marinobacterium rhizophilum]UTW12420.1 hypothetical protein KDW95_01675 [Marinobacterium rhizophilum]
MSRLSIRQSAAALALFIVVAGTVGFEFYQQRAFMLLASGALVVYFVTSLTRLNRDLRVLLLGVLLGVAAMRLLGLDIDAALFEGAARACLFASFLAALGMLRHAAQGSSLIGKVGDIVGGVKPSWRYLLLNGGGQFLSALLAAGALNILSTAVHRGNQGDTAVQRPDMRLLRERRMITAVLRGHCMAQSWAPTSMFVALMLAMVPGLQWRLLLPYCAAMALLSLLLGWVLDQLLCSRHRPVASPVDAPMQPMSAGKVALFPLLAPLLVLFSVLCGLTFGLVLWLDVRFVIAVVIGFPLFSIAWSLLQQRDLPSCPAGLAEAFRSQLFDGFSSQYNEIGLMGSSVFIGVLVASRISPEQIDAVLATGIFSPVGLVIAAAWSIPVLGLLGVNPMVTVTIVAGLSNYIVQVHFPVVVFAVALLGAWCVTAGLSPFAQPVLIVSRNIMRGPGQVGFAWNGLYSLAVMLILTLWVYWEAAVAGSVL